MKKNSDAKIFKGLWIKSAFSLMEMMVVLLIISIIAAATAPMVSKKMSKQAGTGDSPWVFTSTRGDVAYNMGGENMSAIIGASSYDASGGPTAPRLVLAGDNGNHPAMVFATRNGSTAVYKGQFNMTETSVTMNGGTGTVGSKSIAVGMAQGHHGNTGTVALGYNASVNGNNTIAIGQKAQASGASAIAIGSTDEDVFRTSAASQDSIAIGAKAKASQDNSIAIGAGSLSDASECIAIGKGVTADNDGSFGAAIAIGRGDTKATGGSSTAIGCAAQSTEFMSMALGHGAKASHHKSVAIGPYAQTTANWQIVLGSAKNGDDNQPSTVYIPGNLIVNGDVLLANGNTSDSGSSGHAIYLKESGGNYDIIKFDTAAKDHTMYSAGEGNARVGYFSLKYRACDRRLKNIGKKYESGLAELKKLDFYHFTFKADKDKTPQVGVIAQDLQKVFPTAVIKGDDGYFRIRWDEIFYAVINAVKELDNRIYEVANNVKANFDSISKLQETVKTQQKTIEELKKQNAEFEKRLEKLEKAN